MTIRPILFSAPMVNALIEGRKTQTRRRAKFVARDGVNLGFSGLAADHLTPSTWALVSRGAGGCWNERSEVWRCPYVVGDVLWVRETWFDGYVGRDGVVEDWTQSEYHYRATEPDIEGVDDGDGYSELNADGSLKSPWRPSIFMPRKASRLTLAVTDVRVERLQDLSEADARAEGIEFESADPPFYYVPGIMPHSITAVGVEELGGRHAERSYAKLWDHINDKPGIRWADNPWIVAVIFDVHNQNVDAYLAALSADRTPNAQSRGA